MNGCKPVETPMDPNIKLEACGEGILVDRGKFQRLVGKLIYLTHTRPNINFAVNKVSQFLSNPSEGHMEAVYQILRYLKKDPGRGLMFKKTINRSIKIYSNVDWAGSAIDWKSTSCYCSYVWGNIVTWQSKKQ